MLKNTALNTGSSVVYFFLQWLTTVLAVRWAGYETAGLYALSVSFATVFYFIALFGIRNYEISDVTGLFTRGQYFAARILTAAVSLLAFGVAVLTAKLSSYARLCYCAYMLFKLGEAYTQGYFAFLQIRDDYRSLAFSYTAKGIASTAAFSVSLLITKDLLSSTLWMTLAFFLCVLLIDFPYLKKAGIQKPAFAGCLPILRKCVPLMLVSLSVPLMNYVTRFSVERYFGDYWVGQYTSLSFVIVVLSTFAGTVFIVFVPEVSRWKENRQISSIRGFFLKALLAMLGLGAVAVLAGKFLGPWVCRMLFGEKIMESIDLLVPLIVTAVLMMGKCFLSTMLVPLGQRWPLLIGELAGVVVCCGLALPLTKHIGMQGTNLSYLIGILVQIAVLGGCALRTLHRLRRAAESA